MVHKCNVQEFTCILKKEKEKPSSTRKCWRSVSQYPAILLGTGMDKAMDSDKDFLKEPCTHTETCHVLVDV